MNHDLRTKKALYAPLQEWYPDHGLKTTALHCTIDYEPQKLFIWFVNQATEYRHKGDEDSDKALPAEASNLLGNSAYGKLTYTKDQGTVGRAKRSVCFDVR